MTSTSTKRPKYFSALPPATSCDMLYCISNNSSYYWNGIEWIFSELSIDYLQDSPDYTPVSLYQVRHLNAKAPNGH